MFDFISRIVFVYTLFRHSFFTENHINVDSLLKLTLLRPNKYRKQESFSLNDVFYTENYALIVGVTNECI